MAYMIISILLVIASLAFSVFRFQIVAMRTWQALKDLGLSVLYYSFNAARIYGAVRPTVTEIPSEMPQLLPVEFDTFKVQMAEFWGLLKSKENFDDYLIWCLNGLVDAIPLIYFLILLAVVIALVLWLRLKPGGKPKRWEEDKKEKSPTRSLRAWLWFENHTFCPLARLWRSYKAYLKERKLFKFLLIVIWLYNLNVFTIGIEALAYMFFWSTALTDSLYDVKIYSQVVKLVLDLSVSMNFLPWWLKIYIGVKIWNFWRERVGDKRVHKADDKNGELLEENPGTIFITGKPRSGKGLLGADMVSKQEVKFRKDAEDGMRDCRVEFPYFPWDRLERFMQQAIDKHVLYTKEGTRDFIDGLRYMHYNAAKMDEWVVANIKYRLKDFCGYPYDDYLFGYDWKQYGTSYNNGIVMVSIFDTLVDYAQLYFVYDAPTSLIFSTQGIRVDFKRETVGYRPKYDLDYLKRKPEELDEISTYSHIKNGDSERLGRRINPDDPIQNGYEVAVVYEPEIDKERGNQNTNAGLKADSSEVNQKNDLYGMEEKMHNHITTIRYRSYYRKIIDSQRNGAVAADTTEMTLEFQIVESKKEKVVLPFFWLEEGLYKPLKKIYDKLYDEIAFTGETRTLFAHLIQILYMPIARRYERFKNRFGTQEKILRITNGQNGEVIEKKAVWIVIFRRAKAKRYSTDIARGLYRKRVIYRSEGGMNDFKTFKGIDNTGDELMSTNSLFYKNFPKYFNGEYETERKRLLLEKELREKEVAAKKNQAEKGKQAPKNGKDGSSTAV